MRYLVWYLIAARVIAQDGDDRGCRLGDFVVVEFEGS